MSSAEFIRSYLDGIEDVVKGIELDWAVAKDPGASTKDDPSTRNQMIEYHPVTRTWKGETNVQSYRLKRMEQIRNRGINCEVRFI